MVRKGPCPATVSVLGGAAAGVVNTLTGHPFDTLKVWSQTSGVSSTGAPGADYVRRLSPYSYLRILYRGVGPPLITVPLIVSLHFTLWEHAREAIWRRYPNLHPSLCGWAAGFLSGCFVSHITNPVHVLKVQLQTAKAALAPGETPESAVTVASRLVRQRGLHGLFRGYGPHLLQETLGRAAYMGTYVHGKSILAARAGVDGGGPPATVPLAWRIPCAAAAGVAGWAFAYPCDVVRNNMMSGLHSDQYKLDGAWVSVQRILRAEGVLGLYRGFSWTLMRAVPVATVTLPTYDAVCALLEKHM